jgi:branched-chain amino acid transport system substrate-binding protein
MIAAMATPVEAGVGRVPYRRMEMRRQESQRRAWRLAALIAVLSAAVISAAAATAGVRATAREAKSSTVTLGMVWSLSGAYSAYVPAVDGVNLAINQINAAGGVSVGGTHYKLALKVVDDRSDPQTAIASATQLIRDDHVKVIMGPIGNNAPGIFPLTAKYKVINLTTNPAAMVVFPKSQIPLAFSTLPSPAARASTAIAALKKFVPGISSLAIIAPDDASGAVNEPLVTNYARAAGWSVRRFIYPPTTTDLTTLMSQVAAFHPSAILNGWSIPNARTASAAFDAAGISKSTPILLWGGAYGNASLTGGRPYIADPVQESDFTVPNPTPAAAAFKAVMTKFLGSKPFDPNQVVAEFFYNGVKMLAVAMSKANSVTNTTAIAKAMSSVKIKGIAGKTVQFDKLNIIHNGLDYTYLEGNTSQTIHIG